GPRALARRAAHDRPRGRAHRRAVPGGGAGHLAQGGGAPRGTRISGRRVRRRRGGGPGCAAPPRAAGMAVLIDSSVFIALERRGAGADDVLTLVPDEPVALVAVSASELLFGVERADTPQRRARRERFVEAMLALIPVLPVGTAEARVHARVWAGLAASGLVIGAHDLL